MSSPHPLPSSSQTGQDICAQCDGIIPAGAPFGQCPGCLLSLASGIGTSRDDLSWAGEFRLFGDYELIEEISRGGMGVVYRARQLSLGREVAVKMILAGELATEESVQRFRNEAAMAAQLDHPNILPVYEVGEREMQHFFSMRLIPGGRNVAHWAQQLPKPATKPVALMMARAARAVAFAHERGVLHRDLKPSNILVDEMGEPQICDFGLAKQMDARDSLLTLPLTMLGSPSYMAPEQADGLHRDLTTATDVYGLGAVLYELLAGRPPFLGASALSTARKVVDEMPRPLDGIARDLATICLKCLAKEPSQRYAGAQALAEDLERFARGEPILARPVSTPEAIWRWGKRNPKTSGLLGAVAIALVTGFAAVVWQWRAAEASRENAEIARRYAEIARYGEASAHAKATATVVDLYTGTGLVAAKDEDGTRAALWFAQAAATTGADEASRQANLQRWAAWRGDSVTPLRAFPSDLHSQVGSMVWHSPSQDALILRGSYVIPARDEILRRRITEASIWDLPGEKRWLPGVAMTAATWTPDGRCVVYGDGQMIRLVEYPSGKEGASLPCSAETLCLAASPDSRWVAIGAARPLLWEPATGRTLSLPAAIDSLMGLEFSRNGKWLLLSNEKQRGVCSLEQPGNLLFPPVDHLPGTEEGFLADGDLFIAHGLGDRLEVRRSIDGEVVESYPAASDPDNGVKAVSRDGRFIARENSDVIQRPGGPLNIPRPKNNFSGVAFSDDSSLFAYASYDDSVRLFPLPEPGEGRQIGWHQDGATGVSISPDNNLVATFQTGGNLVRVWQLPASAPIRRLEGYGDSKFRVSPDGTLVLPSGTPDFRVAKPLLSSRVHRLDTLAAVGPELSGASSIMAADFGPADQTWIVVARSTAAQRDYAQPPVADSGTIEFIDYLSGARLGEPLVLDFEPRSLAVHPDGKKTAVYGSHSHLIEIDVATREIHLRHSDPVDHYDHPNAFCRYSPDGRMLLAWGMEQPTIVWDTIVGRRVPTPQWDGARLMDMDFHGETVVSASIDSRLDFLTLPSGQPAAAPVQETNWLFLSRFSPEGDLVLTGGRGRIARVWDWRRGQAHGPALLHDDEVFAGAFIPGTKAVATGGLDGNLRFWDRDTGRPLRAPVLRESGIMTLAVAPDRQTLISSLRNGDAIEFYDLRKLLPGTGLPAEEALRLAELDASAEIRGGSLEPLSTAKWLGKWRDFRAKHPEWHRW